MTHENGKATRLNLSDFDVFAAPLPVLRTEDRELYERIHAHFVACLQPEDFLQWWLIDRLVVDGWFIRRYSYHKTLSVERWFEQDLEFQVQRMKSQHARRQAFLGDRAKVQTAKPADVAHVVELENKVVETSLEIDDVLNRIPDDIAHNRALERGIAFQLQLDELITSATKRFNEALELFEHYRGGLGQRLRRAAEELLILECTARDETVPEQTEAPASVPSEGAMIECQEVSAPVPSGEEVK